MDFDFGLEGVYASFAVFEWNSFFRKLLLFLFLMQFEFISTLTLIFGVGKCRCLHFFYRFFHVLIARFLLEGVVGNGDRCLNFLEVSLTLVFSSRHLVVLWARTHWEVGWLS